MSIRLVATCSIPKCDTKQKMGYVALAGLRYVFVTPGIRLAVLLLSLLLFLTYPYQMILPVIAKYTLHGDELMYSQLASSCGMGSMTGAFIPIRFHGRIRPGVAVVYCMSLTALCMMMLSVAGSLFTASVCVFLAGMGYSSCFGILRGYVTASTEMSIVGVVGGWSSTFWYGALALSSMLFGVVADKFGHAPVLILCGMLTLVTAVVASRLQSLKTL